MKKALIIVLIVCTLTLGLTACGHEHEWSAPTYDNPSTCAQCGETNGSSIKEMLLGEWKEEGTSSSTYIGITFTNEGFSATMYLSGEAFDTFSTKGTVTVSDDRLQLTNSSGGHYETFRYTINENGISLVGSDGKSWMKTGK